MACVLAIGLAGCGGGGDVVPGAAADLGHATAVHTLLATEFPTSASPVVAIKGAANRWIVRTPVQDGAAGDYAEYEMYDAGGYLHIEHAWAVHSIRGVFAGVQNLFLEQDRQDFANVSTVEFGFFVGRMKDPFNDPAYYGYYGFGHGNLDFLGCRVEGGANGENLCDNAPVGQLFRGSLFVFAGSYYPKLLDGTRIGTTAVAHTFTQAGLQVDHSHDISAPGIGGQNSYAALLPTTGINRIKPMGLPVALIGRRDGSMAGSWGAVTRFAAFNSAEPRQLLELDLPFGGPGEDTASWSADTETQAFALDQPMHRKLYINWRSGSKPVPMEGQSRHRTHYSVRLGDPL